MREKVRTVTVVIHWPAGFAVLTAFHREGVRLMAYLVGSDSTFMSCCVILTDNRYLVRNRALLEKFANKKEV